MDGLVVLNGPDPPSKHWRVRRLDTASHCVWQIRIQSASTICHSGLRHGATSIPALRRPVVSTSDPVSNFQSLFLLSSWRNCVCMSFWGFVRYAVVSTFSSSTFRDSLELCKARRLTKRSHKHTDGQDHSKNMEKRESTSGSYSLRKLHCLTTPKVDKNSHNLQHVVFTTISLSTLRDSHSRVTSNTRLTFVIIDSINSTRQFWRNGLSWPLYQQLPTVANLVSLWKLIEILRKDVSFVITDQLITDITTPSPQR